jgi:plasmid stabilization system protein ParE
MSHALTLRPRALKEAEAARDRYASVGHGESFLDELESVLDAISDLPLRFPVVHGTVRRALLRRYPFAVFFRIRPRTEQVVILAVFPQRGNPARWPKR